MSTHTFVKRSPCAVLLSLIFLINSCYLFKTNPAGDPPEFPERSEIMSQGVVDYEWSFFTLDGEEKTLKDYANIVIFMTIWATRCEDCLSELPSIQTLYDSMMGENVVFMLLSDEEEDSLIEFVETNGLNVPVYTYKNELPDVLKAIETPSTYIIDRHGSIVFKHIGAAKWDGLTTRKFLRELQ
ncbi:MAG: TlpA family protein disulfide reductase [Gemmatimonadota bacterium]|nr:MAG: TlpA family protein disulfide reductase [Gemmatimonadota bacterium]